MEEACRECGAEFITLESLRRHLRSAHGYIDSQILQLRTETRKRKVEESIHREETNERDGNDQRNITDIHGASKETETLLYSNMAKSYKDALEAKQRQCQYWQTKADNIARLLMFEKKAHENTMAALEEAREEISRLHKHPASRMVESPCNFAHSNSNTYDDAAILSNLDHLDFSFAERTVHFHEQGASVCSSDSVDVSELFDTKPPKDLLLSEEPISIIINCGPTVPVDDKSLIAKLEPCNASSFYTDNIHSNMDWHSIQTPDDSARQLFHSQPLFAKEGPNLEEDCRKPKKPPLSGRRRSTAPLRKAPVQPVCDVKEEFVDPIPELGLVDAVERVAERKRLAGKERQRKTNRPIYQRMTPEEKRAWNAKKYEATKRRRANMTEEQKAEFKQRRKRQRPPSRPRNAAEREVWNAYKRQYRANMSAEKKEEYKKRTKIWWQTWYSKLTDEEKEARLERLREKARNTKRSSSRSVSKENDAKLGEDNPKPKRGRRSLRLAQKEGERANNNNINTSEETNEFT